MHPAVERSLPENTPACVRAVTLAAAAVAEMTASLPPLVMTIEVPLPAACFCNCWASTSCKGSRAAATATQLPSLLSPLQKKSKTSLQVFRLLQIGSMSRTVIVSGHCNARCSMQLLHNMCVMKESDFCNGSMNMHDIGHTSACSGCLCAQGCYN